jgi:hypothetical protein
MPTFGNSNFVTNMANNVLTNINVPPSGSWRIVLLFVVFAIAAVAAYVVWGPSSSAAGAPASASATCPTTLDEQADGSYVLKPTGQKFATMNDFQQYWHNSGFNERCPIPLLTGYRDIPVQGSLDPDSLNEQTYAKTPIYKVDDYEFSRVFGIEKGGHMIEPRQDYNKIIHQRTFDWADRPMTSDERKRVYAGLKEGFTAAGDLTSEAVNRFGEKREIPTNDPDIDCKISRETKEVARMVEKIYEKDANYEPVITKVGPHHWEVNELKPRRRTEPWFEDTIADNKVVNTMDPSVDLEFRYREKEVTDAAIDPYFGTANPIGGGNLPFSSEKHGVDKYYGPVPGMERMFGPTFDRKSWE